MKRSLSLASAILFTILILTCGDSEQIVTPVMNLETGTYSTDIDVTITTATEGATIYYTTDGSAPTVDSAVYSAPVEVAGDGTVMVINAIAIKNFTRKSDVASRAYSIDYGDGGAMAPVVIAVTPVNDSADVAVDSAITATFSVDMDPATINTSTFTLQRGTTDITGTVDYSGTTATFTPLGNLARDSTYLVSISVDAEDTSGNPLSGTYVWFFTTSDWYGWTDMGVVYEAPAAGDAYYPSVFYDADGFGDGTPYKMWYSNGSGPTYVVASSDGETWSAPTAMTHLLTGSHHVQVLYDADCFGVLPCTDGVTAKYRIWFWDTTLNYVISDMQTAESADGIDWANQQAITQNPLALLLDNTAATLWNEGTYGPVFLFYQPGAANTGVEPFDYSYVMYYNGTSGGTEDTGLAYSSDGLYWSAYSANPVLEGNGIGGDEAWDCWSAVYGTVLRDSAGFHFIYSGKGVDSGGNCVSNIPPAPNVFVGIGYAFSLDGKTWVKGTENPIFHISDGVSYRDGRIYTPSVVDDGTGELKMYFSAVASAGGPKKIGLAVLH